MYERGKARVHYKTHAALISRTPRIVCAATVKEAKANDINKAVSECCVLHVVHGN